jgi:Bacteriocin-protection, YdeI or OmpD-Associated
VFSYKYQFDGPLERIKYGRFFYGGVFLPEAILSVLPQARERGFRIVAEVGGLFGEFGLMPVKNQRYIVLSKSVLKQAKLETGDLVLVRFSPIDPNHIEIPVELEQAIESHHAARIAWNNLTPGKRREYSNHVSEATQEATRLKRAYRIVEEFVN